MIALTALALLRECPLHPYEMQRLMHERHKDYAEGRTRALYRAIEELQAAGWIEPVETTREGRRPERTVYRITPEGDEALEDWLQDVLERPAREHLVFTAAVGLLAYLPLDRAVDALSHRVVELRAELAARGRRPPPSPRRCACRGSSCSRTSTSGRCGRPSCGGSPPSWRTCAPAASPGTRRACRPFRDRPRS